MQIHVVVTNDTLFKIANTYGTTIQALTVANELDAPNNLVVGQALVVPIEGQFYFVKKDDTLQSIANKFKISLQELSRINGIPVGNILPIGFRIYIPQQIRTSIESLAFIEPFGKTVSEALENSAKKAAPFLTELLPFSYSVNRDGSLNAPPLNNFKQIASTNRTQLTLVVSNLENGAFNAEIGHIALTVNAVQEKLLDEIVNTAKSVGFSGVQFDFEFLLPSDKDAYSNFLKKAKQRFSQAGLLLSVALAPKTSSGQGGRWSAAHDYEAIGKIVDYVFLMTYEWGYSFGPPQAVSPIDQVIKVVDYALSVMPASKIMLGQNLYGYDWATPIVTGTPARAVSPQQAITIARTNKARIEYDQQAQAPFFIYYDKDKKRREVWFEDARSIQTKFNLVKEKNLRGIGYWKLGLSFPQNWLLLEDNFKIIKR